MNQLLKLHYTRNDQVCQRGRFLVRGEVINIFSAETDGIALRIELLNDELEHLLLFDLLTGWIVQTTFNYTIYPKIHYLVSWASLLQAMEEIKSKLSERR
uniref:hypothetical protein n=1 Tax=Sodalis endosymbiont of Henestaris halophilus TaxID=1929246 RepID=UPI000BE40B03|nr:hypothetical protein [Sodalis endosymbiont of Henestaris halophilus]